MKNRVFAGVFFLGVLPILLFQFREYSLGGGDSDWIVGLVERPLYFFLRAPLVTAFHKGLWTALRDWGWTPADCVSLSSCLAGGVFFLGLHRFSSDWRVWLPVLAGSLPLLFIGHRETYPWPFALSVWVVHLLREHLERRLGPWPLYAVLVLAAFAHPMTLMLWPGVAWAIRPWTQESLKPLLISIVSVLAVTVVLLTFGNAGGFPQRKWVLPLFEVGESLTRYPLFSWTHWKELGWFYLVSMPLGALLALRFGLRNWSGWRGGLHVMAATTLVWSVFWHPGMGYSDWDLFSWPALFVNLAGGFAWSSRSGSERPDRMKKAPPGATPDGAS